MAVEFRNVNLKVGPQTGTPSDQYVAYSDALSSTATSVDACLKAFELRFTGREHPWFRGFLKITGVTQESDRRVKITYTGGIRDSSGTFDDEYVVEGTALVIAETTTN